MVILRWLLSVDERAYKLIRSRVYGCDGYAYSSFCDKAMLAVCIEGNTLRRHAVRSRNVARPVGNHY